jgi:MFS transporter, DHA2 family, multidrug resistance protein
VGDAALLLAVVGIGNGLFAGPNAAAILAATPPELAGTSSGITALPRTMGFSLGPAIGALSWTVAAGGTAALHLGLIVLSAAAAVAVIAILAEGA